MPLQLFIRARVSLPAQKKVTCAHTMNERCV
jgi:hypothetical protein